MNHLKKIINTLMGTVGYSIARVEAPKRSLSFSELWHELPEVQRCLIAPYLPFSKSQYAQDLFVISELGTKSEGRFFIEFGATDGVRWSNSWVLEKKLGWNGVLAEPARTWHDELATNRACAVDHRCVTDSTGHSVEFLETGNPTGKFAISSPELSSMSKYANSGDWASKIRAENSTKYQVETVSLNDLLVYHGAPSTIDYLSIDTEGSELLILEGFDFTKYHIRIITVEHNKEPIVRTRLYELLTSKGYTRKYDTISGADDWYVLPHAD